MKSCGRCGREYSEQVTFCSEDGQMLDSFDVGALCGQVLDGRYRLDEVLGEGAHGVVFRAMQLDIDRDVAVKILHPAKVLHPSVLSEVVDVRDYWLSCLVRFQREAKAAGRLRHPNIVTVTDFGHAPGDVAYLVMEYLTGVSLRHILKARRRLTLGFTLRVMHQVCWAIEAAHRQGVIHRDLKPANIMIESIEGIGEVAKVLDFGIAKLMPMVDQELTNLTDTGVFLGTPKYMSPEQCAGSDLDVRSDVYTLGIVLYEMLTGELPFHGTAISVALQHATAPPRAPRHFVPDLPDAVERVILKAVEKDPAKRYATAAELITELERASRTAGIPLKLDEPSLEMFSLSEDDTSPMSGVSGLGPTSNQAFPLPPPRRSRIEVPLPTTLDEIAAAPILSSTDVAALVATELASVRMDPAEADCDSLVSTRVRPPIPAPPEGMVLIAAGRFVMGCDSGLANERPAHEVYVDPFFVDVTEVTNRQYKLFCDRTSRQYPPNPRWDVTYFIAKPDHPVVNVTWADADSYAKWAGKRLPTEAEWEKSARGGVEGADYPWGNAIDHSFAHYEGAGTCKVRSFAPNGFGLHEIVGNVWEWCSDWYDDRAYLRAVASNPKGPQMGADKVLRGGSMDGTFRTLRVAYRHWMPPSRRSSDVGFRCVKDVY